MLFGHSSNNSVYKTRSFSSANAAVDYIAEIYAGNIQTLQQAFNRYSSKGFASQERVSAYYPFIRVKVEKIVPHDSHFSYGYISSPGTYEAVLTRPDIFRDYYREQFSLLIKNHGVSLEVGQSSTPIPIHFALDAYSHLEAGLDGDKIADLPNHFNLPNLFDMDEKVVNGTYVPEQGEAMPLSLFPAPRVDLSLQRLKHYTGTSPEHFQNFVIFTNYQFYVDQFIKMCQELMSEAVDPSIRDERMGYTSFVEVGDIETFNSNIKDGIHKKGISEPAKLSRMPQMPAYHLKRSDNKGITLVNIGIGPSNAKTITDHIAVLRPHAWLMLGHCAGLRNNQSLGDYALAHAYLREDHVLDKDIPVSIPIPALAEMQMALQASVKKVSGLSDDEVKEIMRTGTVATMDDRNWEFKDQKDIIRRLSQSRAIALDMESATIAANGFRFRVPYGTLLCVSDKPLHGQLKLPGMADDFYRKRVEQHLKIGVMAMEELRRMGPERLHSRKLRSFHEVAFQ